MRCSRLTMYGVIWAAAISNPLWAAEVGTAFTYQGVLENPPGNPLNDTCAFEFALCDDAVAACAPGTVSSHPAVEVTYGVFTVPEVDFGDDACNGEARWMAISVMCSGDAGFVALSPRVELTPAPYALRAVEGVGPPAGIHVAANGNVGLGTTTPATKLHVAVAGHNGVFVEGNGTGDARYSLENGGGPHFIFDDDSDAHAFKIESASGRALAFNTSGPIERMRIDQDGNVGVGTATPAAQLDVNGAARATTVEITGGTPFVSEIAGWGSYVYGQTDAPAGPFTVMAAGYYHSVAIRSDGTLVGWGRNGKGETIVPSGMFTAVAAGYQHSLAIRSGGTLIGWGDNSTGQINGPTGTFGTVAAGYWHSLGIRSDGTLIGWGDNTSGQTNVPPGTFTAIAAGGAHSIGIRSDGTLVGWGNNQNGQTDVPAGTFGTVAAGDWHSLGIRSDGTMIGWGDNTYGQITIPTGTFTAAAAGSGYSLAIRDDGTLVAWGRNIEGQTDVPAGTFIAVAAGGAHSLAIRSDPPAANPALRLYADSAFKPGSNTWTIWSDRRLKKNITPLSGALDHLLQLRGVTFNWMDPASQGGITGTQMGLIADEVQRVFPQWVGRDPKGYQTLTVGGFEALTAEALRELREEKDCEIEDLKSEINDLKEMVKEIQKGNKATRQQGKKDGGQ